MTDHPFPGFSSPTTPLQPVRDERRTQIRHYDIDLSTARSIAAGTQLELPLGGNLIYFDQRASGFATMYVQNDEVGSCGLTVFAGWKAAVPFTRLVFENTAQPGMTLRLVYGVDLDLDPGIGAGVSVLNAVNVRDVIQDSCQLLYNNWTPGIGAFSETVLLAAATNVRGAVLRAFTLAAAAGAGGSVQAALAASATAFAAFASKTQAIVFGKITNSTTNYTDTQNPALYRQIPAGWGVRLINVNTVAAPNIIAEVSIEVL